MMTFTKKNYAIGSFITAIIGAFAVWYYVSHRPCEGVQPYDAARDREFVIKLFKDNWDWLIASENYLVEFMLDNKASSQDPASAGNLQLFTLCSDGKPVGFTAFYRKNFYKAQILFLVVPESERRKGYAEKMLKFDLEELKRQGFSLAQILTRLDNIRAQNLYKKLGFTEYWRDDRFMRLELPLK
jgi:ribosomal protein S18 acetylase RimI-like enzyme